MREEISKIVEKYLSIYSDEKEKLERLTLFLKEQEDVFDWNNFNGHITVGAFLYSKKEDEFLVLYHKDLMMYLYPGGHIDESDSTPLIAAMRELREETGLDNIVNYSICDNELVPIDIDIHMIDYNERLNLPAHYHFDFRYLFIIDEKVNIKVDKTEIKDYRWISFDEFKISGIW